MNSGLCCVIVSSQGVWDWIRAAVFNEGLQGGKLPYCASEVSSSAVEGSSAFLILLQAVDRSVKPFFELGLDVGDRGNSVEVSRLTEVGKPGQEVMPNVVGSRARDSREGQAQLLDKLIKQVTGGTLEDNRAGGGGATSGGLIKAARVKIRGWRSLLRALLV